LCIWEGSSDYYRELCRHGGILSDFLSSWYPRQVASVQHGVGERGARSTVTGELVAGPDTLPEAELAEHRADIPGEAKRRRLLDDYYAARTPQFEAIEAPLLSAANWGGMGLHPRGNFEGWLHAGSKQKWLEVHGDTHFTHFYSKYGEELQSASSVISSKAKIPAGSDSRACRSIFVILAKNSSCVQRPSGHSRVRAGRNIFCSRTAAASAPTSQLSGRR
jgi:predicted acyl esterase